MAENNINSQAWRDSVSATKDCLPLQVLESLAAGSSDSAASQHLSGCPHCQAELAMLKSFESSVPSKNEGAAAAWIAAQLERKQNSSSAKAGVPRPFWRNFFRVPYLAGALALVLAAGLGISLYVSDREPRSPLNNPGTEIMRSGSVRLTSPSGDLARPAQEFHWEAYPGAKKYRVEVLEVDGNVLWSGQSDQTSIATPPELQAKMLPGKTLQWKVTALDDSGKPIASSSQERFLVRVPTGH
jgi:hypothetical protein